MELKNGLLQINYHLIVGEVISYSVKVIRMDWYQQMKLEDYSELLGLLTSAIPYESPTREKKELKESDSKS